jgi:hypothetical protein
MIESIYLFKAKPIFMHDRAVIFPIAIPYSTERFQQSPYLV